MTRGARFRCIRPPAAFSVPLGGGEPGVQPAAPALTNAILTANGKRIRPLPIGDQIEAPQGSNGLRWQPFRAPAHCGLRRYAPSDMLLD